MTEEELKDKLRKMLSSTKRANECGLSNNDFNEDIDTLSGALGLLDKKDKKIDLMARELSRRPLMIYLGDERDDRLAILDNPKEIIKYYTKKAEEEDN